MKFQEVANAIAGAGAPAEYVHFDSLTNEADGAMEKQIEDSIVALTKRAQDFSSNSDLWETLLALMEQTRIAASERRWIAARQSLTEATVLVNRAIASESLARVRVRLAFLPLAWFVFMFGLQSLIEWMARVGSTPTWVDMVYFQYLWMGMLGGTTVVLWGIVKHGTDMTFDRSYIIWYVFKPALGAIMGMLVVMTVQAGFLALSRGSSEVDLNHNISLWVLAFIGGFSERFFIKVIDRVVTSVLGGEKDSSPSGGQIFTKSRPREQTIQDTKTAGGTQNQPKAAK